jgi:enterochelin esterase-like enzyme
MMRSSWRTLLLALTLAACSPQAHLSSPATAPTASPSANPPTTPTATATLPASTPTPATSACPQAAGRFESFEIIDESLPRALVGQIYLPPCFDPGRSRPYPVLFLLHGLAADEQQWRDLGAGRTADQLIRRGVSPPFLIVLPAERKGLDFAQAFPDVLLPFVQDQYHAAPARAQRALGGLSRGAGWALRIGLTHPSLFGRLGLHSPAVLLPDLLYLPRWLEDMPAGLRPAISIDIGDRDTLLPDAVELQTTLRDLGMDVLWQVNPGYHEASYWSSHLEEYLAWYSASWAEAR